MSSRGPRRGNAAPGAVTADRPFSRPSPGPYPPLREYAVIGDCHGSALVSRAGSVDWCCLGRFDADPALCRLLDWERGGFLEVRPEGAYRTARDYLPETNVLHTVFRMAEGAFSVTDFMPVGRASGSGVHDYTTLRAPFWLVRVVNGLEGSVPVRVRYRPSVDFGRERPELAVDGRRVRCPGGPELWAEAAWGAPDGPDLVEARLTLEAGERRRIVLSAEPIEAGDAARRTDRMLEITRSFWEEWSGYCTYEGPWRDEVLRSALALKLLTYAPSGAIVAAPTTSLPEWPGGERNWDYRYCWLRDSALTLEALSAIGYTEEAQDFSTFLLRASRGTRPRLQIMYGVLGETDLEEEELDHLAGWRGSRPVRRGNGAYSQEQTDIYGEVLDWAHQYERLGGRFSEQGEAFLHSLLDHVAGHWEEPDRGMWEMRSGPMQHVHGKIMSWVAADRIHRMFGDERAAELRDRIRDQVLERGVDPATGGLRHAYDVASADAGLLMAPALGFPAGDETLEATVRWVEERLREGDLVRRYHVDDGAGGREGAFLMCSFWLVDALLFTGRAEEARQLFERLLEHSNDVGLYSEAADPGSGELLGNFPQAFTHLALVRSATYLDRHERGETLLAEGASGPSRLGRPGLLASIGTLRRSLERSARTGLWWSSRSSVLPEGWTAAAEPEDWRMPAEALTRKGLL